MIDLSSDPVGVWYDYAWLSFAVAGLLLFACALISWLRRKKPVLGTFWDLVLIVAFPIVGSAIYLLVARTRDRSEQRDSSV